MVIPLVKHDWDELGYIRTAAAALRRELRATPFDALASRPPVEVKEFDHRGHRIVLVTAVEVQHDDAVILIRVASVSRNTYTHTHAAVVAQRSGRWSWPAKEHYGALEVLADRIEHARPLAREPRRVFPGCTYAGRKLGFGVGLIDVAPSATRPAG